jgi:sugar phosphate permease
MFCVEGLMASLVGVWAFFYLADRPARASWMPPDEREALGRALAEEEEVKRARGNVTFRSVFCSPRLLHFTMIYFLIQVSGYGIAFYLPTQVSALMGKKVGLAVGLISAIPWACAVLTVCFWPGLAVRTGYRRTFAVVSLIGTAAGLCLSAHLEPRFALAALCLATAGVITVQPIFWTYPTEHLGGIGAAAGIAAINALGNVGGFLAPNLKTWLEQSLGSSSSGLYFLACAGVLAALLICGLKSEVDRCQMGSDR